MMAATVEKFLFETCFDGEGAPEEPAQANAEGEDAAAAPPPAYDEAELQAAREDAYAAGRAAGIDEAEANADRALAEALAVVGERLERLLSARREVEEQAGRAALEAAMLLLRRLFPEFERRHGFDEIEGIVAESLERLREEPRIVVRVADARLDELRARIDDLAARCGYPGKVVLLAEEGLSDGDARVEWADGGAERDSARLWNEVDGLLRRALPAADGEADAEQNAEPQPAEEDGGRVTADEKAAPPPAGEAHPKEATGEDEAADADRRASETGRDA